MYDDEDEFEEDEGEIGIDAGAVAYAEKGKADRSFVDQQAKEYDEAKRKKREELAHLKILRLEAQSKLSHKERELAALELSIRKDEYLETRERVKDERDIAMSEEVQTREQAADTEVSAINLESERRTREQSRDTLRRECAVLKTNADEAGRKISLLEYEIIRS